MSTYQEQLERTRALKKTKIIEGIFEDIRQGKYFGEAALSKAFDAGVESCAPTEVVTLLETLPAEATPEMIAAVSTILQPYAAKLVWQRMLLAARSTTRDEPQGE